MSTQANDSDSDALSDFDSDDMMHLVEADLSEDEDGAQCKRERGRTLRARTAVDYTAEKNDEFFSAEKGFTHFGRTRKGGDIRPRAKQVMLPTMFVFLYRYSYRYSLGYLVISCLCLMQMTMSGKKEGNKKRASNSAKFFLTGRQRTCTKKKKRRSS